MIDRKSGVGRDVGLLRGVARRIVTRHAFGRETDGISAITIFVE